MNKNLKTLFFKISDVTSKLNTLIPKKRDRIVIYSNWGFRDNIRTLYQYLVDNGYQDKYEIVCASNNFYHLKKDNRVKFVSIYRGLYYFLIYSISGKVTFSTFFRSMTMDYTIF